MAYVHVVIPCYNAEKWLKETVYSVLIQPFKDIDIVLVDDGSPGRTPQICDNLAETEPRVHVIHKTNGGVASARNRGLEYVLDRTTCESDEYIVFLDADDFWVKDFFTTEVVEQLHCKYDLIGFSHAEQKEGLSTLEEISNDLPTRIVTGGPHAIWAHEKRHLGCLFVRTAMLKQYGIRFPDGLEYNEDEIFKVYAECLSRQMCFCNRLMYVYRLHNASAVHNLERDVLNRYQRWICAWKNVDEQLKQRYQIETDFGERYAINCTLEMCVSYVQSIVTYRQFRDLLNTPSVNEALLKVSADQCPTHLKDNHLLISRSVLLFYLKHTIFGLLRLFKRNLSAVKQSIFG